MIKPKKHKGDVSFVINFDLKTGELDDFMWDEDHEVPPMVRPKIKRREEKELAKKN